MNWLTINLIWWLINVGNCCSIISLGSLLSLSCYSCLEKSIWLSISFDLIILYDKKLKLLLFINFVFSASQSNIWFIRSDVTRKESEIFHRARLLSSNCSVAIGTGIYFGWIMEWVGVGKVYMDQEMEPNSSLFI